MNSSRIRIEKKKNLKGEDGTRVISIRIKEEMLERIDKIAREAERSRNEVINIIFENSVDKIIIE